MKSNKGFAPIAIVLIIIAVLAVGGIAYYAGKGSNFVSFPSSQNQNQQAQNNTEINTTPSAPEAPKKELGRLKSITNQNNNEWLLAVDFNYNDNQNPEITNLNVTNTTKTYGCGIGANGERTGLIDTLNYISEMQAKIKNKSYKVMPLIGFDVNGTNIVGIYPVCFY